jgi:hypothetical protein
LKASASPVSLLLHDGELTDVYALMAQLGLQFIERRGAPVAADESRAWDLVIATPRRLLEFDAGAAGSVPVCIAVLEKDSKTLRAMLHRAGIDLLVRRPVHPAALRMLILHSLYRGPEKRRSLRVSVGAPVRVRLGLRRRPALLAELSVTGCRLLCTQTIERGRRLTLQLPGSLAGGRGLHVGGEVVRSLPADRAGVTAVAVAFSEPTARQQERLRAVVAAHSGGPAVLSETGRHAALVTTPELPERETRDRRRGPRHEYPRHVIALGVEAARVLIGRDISVGGMRVDPNPCIAVGDDVRIAVHLKVSEDPLVVRARVQRDDGERGLVLRFHELDAASRESLERMVGFLPVLGRSSSQGDEGEVLLVSELIDRRGTAEA